MDIPSTLLTNPNHPLHTRHKWMLKIGFAYNHATQRYFFPYTTLETTLKFVTTTDKVEWLNFRFFVEYGLVHNLFGLLKEDEDEKKKRLEKNCKDVANLLGEVLEKLEKLE